LTSSRTSSESLGSSLSVEESDVTKSGITDFVLDHS
jgi:hypothetical protein